MIPPPRKRGRPLGSKTKTTKTTATESDADGAPPLAIQPEGQRKPLPTEPKAREEALALNSLPAGMIVSSISAVMEAAELSPLKPVEKDEGQMAFSALLYEYGANISAGVLVILWCVGVIAPRLIEYFDRKKEEKKKAMEPGAHLLPENTAKAA